MLEREVCRGHFHLTSVLFPLYTNGNELSVVTAEKKGC